MYTKLASFQYKVVYKPTTSNLVVNALSHHPTPPHISTQYSTTLRLVSLNALSRHPAPPSHINTISYYSTTWLSKVVNGYAQDLIPLVCSKHSLYLPSLILRLPSLMASSVTTGMCGLVTIDLCNWMWLQPCITTRLADTQVFMLPLTRWRNSSPGRLWNWISNPLLYHVPFFIKPSEIVPYLGLLSPLPIPTEAW